MKTNYLKIAVITTVGIVTSGLIWLLIYVLRFRKGIGFDGPAGGILGLTLIGGWIISSAVSLKLFKRNKQGKTSLAILTVFVIGIVVGLGTGYAIGSYALNHYPDGGSHPLTTSP